MFGNCGKKKRGNRHASVYTVPERLCLHPRVGVFAGAVYESLQQPRYLSMGYPQLRGILYHVHYGGGILPVKGNRKENRDKGSHTEALWTAFFRAKGQAQEDFPVWAFGESCILDMDVHVYLVGGSPWELFGFRGYSHGFPGAERDLCGNEAGRCQY